MCLSYTTVSRIIRKQHECRNERPDPTCSSCKASGEFERSMSVTAFLPVGLFRAGDHPEQTDSKGPGRSDQSSARQQPRTQGLQHEWCSRSWQRESSYPQPQHGWPVQHADSSHLPDLTPNAFIICKPPANAAFRNSDPVFISSPSFSKSDS